MSRSVPAVSSTRVALRVAFVVASALVALAIFLPTVALGWRDAGETGFRINTGSGRILEVRELSPAARAGLRVGDVVIPSSLTPAERALVFDVGAVPPDMRLDFAIERGGVRRAVALVTARRTLPSSTFGIAIACLQAFEYLVFVLTGAALVLLRPSPMTWALYAYCLCTAQIHDGFLFYDQLPPDAFVAFYLFGATFLTGFAPVPLLPFVARFPNDATAGWRRSLARLATAIAVVSALHWGLLAIAGIFLPDLRPAFAAYYRLVHVVAAVGVYAAAALILLKTYEEAGGSDRPRLQWAVFGMAFSFAAMALGYVTSAMSPLSFSVTRAINLLSIVMPISITYAILKHRLIDVRFVANRAAVYAVMTTIVIVLLELIDWLVTNVLAEDHWAKVAEGLAAVALGFASDRLHRVVQATIEKVLFRQRHRAEQHLLRVGTAFAFTQSEHSIGEGLTVDASEALALASAAVFRPQADGRSFTRASSVGWSERDARDLDVDDALVRYLQAEEDTIAIADVHWKRTDLPQGDASPALAIPLCVRHTIVGIVLYGIHRSGAQIDPAEVAVLRRLCGDAARAFDHADAEEVMQRLERRNAELEVALRRLEPSDAPRPVQSQPIAT